MDGAGEVPLEFFRSRGEEQRMASNRSNSGWVSQFMNSFRAHPMTFGPGIDLEGRNAGIMATTQRASCDDRYQCPWSR